MRILLSLYITITKISVFHDQFQLVYSICGLTDRYMAYKSFSVKSIYLARVQIHNISIFTLLMEKLM